LLQSMRRIEFRRRFPLRMRLAIECAKTRRRILLVYIEAMASSLLSLSITQQQLLTTDVGCLVYSCSIFYVHSVFGFSGFFLVQSVNFF
jgi:hypothetical protein